MDKLSEIEIQLDYIYQGLRLWINERRPNTLFDAQETAMEHGEARFQLKEGCLYDYELSNKDYALEDPFDRIVIRHKRNSSMGTISPNIYVGTLEIPVLYIPKKELAGFVKLEVQSIKSDYREDYRDMLEFITEKCTDLLLQANSPVSQNLDIDYNKDPKTLYQRFAFINSIIETDEFVEAVHRIVTMPVTKWAESTELRDIRNTRRFSNANIKELVQGGNRVKLPKSHYLNGYGLQSIPSKITAIRKVDSVDTPENRFVKHALETFLKFCTDIHEAATKHNHSRLLLESEFLIHSLENQLHHIVFREISKPTTLKLNSPVLQRKEGYREVLRAWLLFDLAAKLIWKGGEDVYGAGKKDIAILYEYWLFFKLLDLFQEVFNLEQKEISDLIQPTRDGLSLQIKQGISTPLRGVYDSGNRKLNIRFNYNRSFSGKNSYPDAGSWTTTLRPDYTLTIWPFGINEEDAEVQELIVHVHFDAKYKVANLWEYIEKESSEKLDLEKLENRKGIYKNADLHKMHAYKDAIRRTVGAYVLYPGTEKDENIGFHEIIPGLGAFPVRPSKYSTGIDELRTFVLNVVKHFLNRTSQREKAAYRIYDIHKEPPTEASELREALPEIYHANRGLIPDETFVAVGFYNSPEHLKWIKKNKVYNFRADMVQGALSLNEKTVGAKFLLLHTHKEDNSGEIWKIKGSGVKVWSKKTMRKLGYPNPKPKEYYLVFELEEVTEPELLNIYWDFKKLKNYKSRSLSAIPFTTTLAELMRNKI